jgi:hypothetical protein
MEAAEEIGTVREELVRALRLLRETGLVASPRRGHYRVVDRARLQRLTGEPGPLRTQSGADTSATSRA